MRENRAEVSVLNGITSHVSTHVKSVIIVTTEFTNVTIAASQWLLIEEKLLLRPFRRLIQ